MKKLFFIVIMLFLGGERVYRFNEELYSTMFNALRHEARRKILRMLSRGDRSFTTLYETLGISSSHLNYHLNVLDGLVIKRGSKYQLSVSGEAAVTMINRLESPPILKPTFNIFFKYLSVIFFILISSLLCIYVDQYNVSAEAIKSGFIEAFFTTVMTMYPVILVAFLRDYYIIPLNERPISFSGPFKLPAHSRDVYQTIKQTPFE